MRWYVYRHGYNSANNSARYGGPESVRVAIIEEAESAEAACQLAKEEGVSCYHNQFLYAEDADVADKAKAARKRLVKRV